MAEEFSSVALVFQQTAFNLSEGAEIGAWTRASKGTQRRNTEARPRGPIENSRMPLTSLSSFWENESFLPGFDSNSRCRTLPMT